jgi:hypothetical protein
MMSVETRNRFERQAMKNTTRILAVFALAASAGCTNLDGTPNRAATGGLVGAGAGAALGSLIGDGDSGAAIAGGVVGALAGTAIGANQDRQAEPQW